MCCFDYIRWLENFERLSVVKFRILKYNATMFKIIILLVSFIFLSIPVGATTVLVQSREPFSTKFPRRYLTFKVMESCKLKNGINFSYGDIIKGRMIEVKLPKRGKQDAYFIFMPESYTISSKKITKSLRHKNLEAKLSGYEKLNKVKLVEKTSVHAGGLVVPGLSSAYWFSKGAIKPRKGQTRVKSGVSSMYDNSPISYIEQGDELIVKEGRFLKMQFYLANQPKWKRWKVGL